MKCEICGQNKAVKESAYQIGSLITLVSVCSEVCSECAMDIENTNHIFNTKLELKGDIK